MWKIDLGNFSELNYTVVCIVISRILNSLKVSEIRM